MKKILLSLAVIGFLLPLCAASFPYGSSVGKSHPAWNKIWSVTGKMQDVQKGISSGVRGKDLRLTLQKMIPVKKGDVVQLRIFFKGKQISCGVLGYDSKGKSKGYYAGTLKETAGAAESSRSLYYTVPEGVSSVRTFLTVKEDWCGS